jgi:chromosome segregation ATPase
MEGICFALGLELRGMRVHSLSALVNHAARDGAAGEDEDGQAAGRSCAAACSFRGASGAAVVVQRRVRNGRHRDYRLQDCSCRTGDGDAGGAEEDLPWACAVCPRKTVKRSELRSALQARLGLDIDRPTHFVVQQSACSAIVQRTPVELLHVLEDFAHTTHLRVKSEAEAATATQLRGSILALDVELSRALGEKTRHSGALAAAEEVEEHRRKLEISKQAHLRYELADCARVAAAVTASVQRATAELETARAAQQQARSKESELAAEEARAQAQAAETETSLRALRTQLTACKAEETKAGLDCKTHAGAAKRKRKAAARMRDAMSELDAGERAAQAGAAEGAAALREVKEALGLERDRRAAREKEVARSVGKKRPIGGSIPRRGEPTGGSISGCGKDGELSVKSGAEAAGARGSEGGCELGVGDPRVLALEAELLRAEERLEEVEGAQPARQALERCREEENALRERLARAVEAEAAADGKVQKASRDLGVDEAAKGEAETELSRRVDGEGAAARAAEAVWQRVRDAEEETERTVSRSQGDERVEAIVQLRESGQLSGGVRFLCECFTTSEADARPVHAAIGGVLWSTVVVNDRTTALRIIDELRRLGLGVVSCLVLSELQPPPAAGPSAPDASGFRPLASCVVPRDAHAAKVAHRLLSRWSLAPSREAALGATGAAIGGGQCATGADAGTVSAASGKKGGAGGGGSGANRAQQGNVVTPQGECFLSSGEIRAPARQRPSPLLIRDRLVDLRPQASTSSAAAGRGGSVHKATGAGQVEALRRDLATAHAEHQTAVEARAAAAERVQATARAVAARRTRLARASADLEACRQAVAGARSLLPAPDAAGCTGNDAASQRAATDISGAMAAAEARLAALLPSAEARRGLLYETVRRIRLLEARERELAAAERARQLELRLAASRRKALAQSLRSSSAEAEQLERKSAASQEASQRLAKKTAELAARTQQAEEALERLQAARADAMARRAAASEARAAHASEAKRARHAADDAQAALDAARQSERFFRAQIRQAGGTAGGPAGGARVEGVAGGGGGGGGGGEAEGGGCGGGGEGPSHGGGMGPPGGIPSCGGQTAEAAANTGGNTVEQPMEKREQGMEDGPQPPMEGSLSRMEGPGQPKDGFEPPLEEQPKEGHTQPTEDPEPPMEEEEQTTEQPDQPVEGRRLMLRAEERLFDEKLRALPVTELGLYLEASAEAGRVEASLKARRGELGATVRRLSSLSAERGRVFLAAVGELNSRLRETFRALCEQGDASLEYATEPSVLFEEGVSIRARPPRSEWEHFEALSGGQKALVAVALQLSLHPPGAPHPCFYDEVDAALDTRRTRALAELVAARPGAQSVFVSHRPEMVEAASMLVGCYVGQGGGSRVVSWRPRVE